MRSILPRFILFFVLLTVLAAAAPVRAAKPAPLPHRVAIVLAMFGTTVEDALPGMLNIKEEVEKAWPGAETRLAFTSNIIRRIWRERAADQGYRKAHPEVPAEVLNATTPLAVIAALQNEGYDSIVVQPTHLTLSEEYLDLRDMVRALNSITTIKPALQPFHRLVIGRPALGSFGREHPSVDDVAAVAEALAEDVELAAREHAALVYMGHGNDYFPSGGGYLHFEAEMNRRYPAVRTYIGTVEGFPGLDEVIAALKRDGVTRVLLKPFMTVAGDHARNDMAGEEETSWQKRLAAQGITATPMFRGLGEQDAFARVFVEHLASTARDAGITPR